MLDNPWILIPMTALFIPISAIVMGIGSKMIKNVLESQERRLAMRLRLREGKESGTQQQIEALRAEIAALRDTSTQFDVSFDHTLQRLEARMQTIEKARAPYPTTIANQEEQTQRLGGG